MPGVFDPAALSTEELRAELVTLDFHGKEVKTAALRELERRAAEEALARNAAMHPRGG